VSQSRVVDFARIEAEAERTPRVRPPPPRRRRALGLAGSVVAWGLLVPSSVSVGLELERAAHIETWQAITTLGWWQKLAPESFERTGTFLRESVHPLAWDALQSLLALPPAILALGLALLLFLLVAWARERRASPRWVRAVRGLGVALIGLGFAASGSDLYQTGASHSLLEFVGLLHDASAQWLRGVDQPAFAAALGWPAWLALLLPGSLLLWGARIRRRA